jgi:hypothetical protein
LGGKGAALECKMDDYYYKYGRTTWEDVLLFDDYELTFYSNLSDEEDEDGLLCTC